MDPLLILIFILGAIIGSFLNVVVYRYPLMLLREWNDECAAQLNQPLPTHQEKLNLCFPRSHCSNCKKQIPWWLNIPIVSYIFLRGKCVYCRQSIALQYLFIEMISAVLPVLVVMHFGVTIQSLTLIILTWGLITLSFIDFNYQFLPDAITYILLWLGLYVSTHHAFVSPIVAIQGAITGYLFLWCVAKLFFFLRKKEGMGLGDCKMLAMIGAWVGVIPLLSVLIISSGLAIIVSLLLALCKKSPLNHPIPFGPYIAIAGWCVIMYSNLIMPWILKW